MLRLGVPIALQFELEIACFGGVALLAGAMGTVQVASHQIAINLAALTYMVPLGVSAAATVLVGRAVGARDEDEVRRNAATSLLVGAGFMALMAAHVSRHPASAGGTVHQRPRRSSPWRSP